MLSDLGQSPKRRIEYFSHQHFTFRHRPLIIWVGVVQSHPAHKSFGESLKKIRTMPPPQMINGRPLTVTAPRG